MKSLVRRFGLTFCLLGTAVMPLIACGSDDGGREPTEEGSGELASKRSGGHEGKKPESSDPEKPEARETKQLQQYLCFRCTTDEVTFTTASACDFHCTGDGWCASTTCFR